MKKRILPFLLFILALLIPLVFNARPSVVAYINLAIIYAVSAVGLNLLLGVAGQISLGHAAFMGIGGYTSAILMMRYGIPSVLSVLAGGLLAGLFGLVIGFPALRLKGFYLAIATMALGTAVTDVIKRMEVLGADRGLTNVPPITIFGYQFSSEFAKYYLYLAILLLTIFLVNNLLKSKTGMAFRAMRDSEVAAKVFGINISYYKVLAFVISSFLAGVAGAMYGHSLSYLHPDMFGFGLSIEFLAITIIGGIGTLWGPVLGSALWVIVPRLFGTKLEAMAGVLFGVILILVVLFLPRGLSELIMRINKLFSRKEEGERS